MVSPESMIVLPKILRTCVGLDLLRSLVSRSLVLKIIEANVDQVVVAKIFGIFTSQNWGNDKI